MKNEFIELTTSLGKPIIIGVSSISTIDIPVKHVRITLNFSKDKALKTITVKETYEEIKEMLGLDKPKEKFIVK